MALNINSHTINDKSETKNDLTNVNTAELPKFLQGASSEAIDAVKYYFIFNKLIN